MIMNRLGVKYPHADISHLYLLPKTFDIDEFREKSHIKQMRQLKSLPKYHIADPKASIKEEIDNFGPCYLVAYVDNIPTDTSMSC